MGIPYKKALPSHMNNTTPLPFLNLLCELARSHYTWKHMNALVNPIEAP